jgi:hypothetical protein
MKYKLTDQQGNVLASGDQLNFSISADLKNDTIRVVSGAVSVVYPVASEKFTLSFEREAGQ